MGAIIKFYLIIIDVDQLKCENTKSELNVRDMTSENAISFMIHWALATTLWWNGWEQRKRANSQIYQLARQARDPKTISLLQVTQNTVELHINQFIG